MLVITVNEIADYFSRDISATSKGVTKIENGMISDVSLRKLVQEIETSAKEANKKYANS